MTSLNTIRKPEADKRVEQILTCADTALKVLEDRSVFPATLESQLETFIKRAFPLPSSASLAGKAAEFDRRGSQIWNATTNIIREADQDQCDTQAERPNVTALTTVLRVFAFSLIDTAYHISSKRTNDQDQRIRTLKVALKTCRYCLDSNQVELALKVLERCSARISDIEDAEPVVQLAQNPVDENVDGRLTLKRIVCEYYLLRTAHAWKTERLDVASHFCTKADHDVLAQSPDLTEKATDLFHKIGKSLAINGTTGPAMEWCERTIQTLDDCSSEDLSLDAVELRLPVTATLVETLLARGDESSYQRAVTLIQQLEEVFGLGNRIAVSLLQFKTLTHKQPVDVERMSGVLRHMIRLAVLTDQSFKTIMQTIHKARRYSQRCASTTLLEIIEHRLIQDIATSDGPDNPARDRLEKAIVTFVLFMTTQCEQVPDSQLAETCALFDMLSQNKIDLSPKATHAAQTLIWGAAGTSNPEISSEWCTTLLHPVFDRAGQVNKARIGRRAITIALARQDVSAAREAFYRMPPAVQNEIMSRYLAFKIAMQSEDIDLARESLGIISKHASKDPRILYACVLEAQQSNMRTLAVTALQALLDTQTAGVHLPSLLRCIVRLLMGERDVQGADHDQVVGEIVQTFEHAAANVKVLRQATEDQWRVEVQWWSKNAYNLALQLCASAHPEHIVRLLAACIKFIDACPTDADATNRCNSIQRRMICHFLSATSSIVLARSNADGSEYAFQNYLHAQQQISAFLELAGQVTDAPDDQDLSARRLEMLKSQLECVFKLRQWDKLDSTLTSLLESKHIDRWDSLIDLLIVVHEQTSQLEGAASTHGRITELLQRCINDNWKQDRDMTKMSRWLRLAFGIYLDNDGVDLALNIVQQAAGLAKRNDGHTYPGDELQWLAISAFNKAVDMLSVDDREAVTRWIDAALELARYAADNGALHAHLTHKREMVRERMQAVVV